MKRDLEYYYTSDFNPDNPYGIELKNKKVPGLFKDAMPGKLIAEFVGLRSFKTVDEEEKKICKGIKKSVVRNKLRFEDFKNCLFDMREVMRECNTLRSYHHDMYCISVNKVALSAFDDKRYLVNSNKQIINTLVVFIQVR